MSAERDEFMAGYLIAVANIMHTHDNPTIAADVLGEANVDRSVLEGLDLSEFDLEPLNELFDELDRQDELVKARHEKLRARSEAAAVGGR